MPFFPPTPAIQQPSGNSSNAAEDLVRRWAAAVQQGDWPEVYRLGAPFLDAPEAVKSPSGRKLIGFTWFAAYFQARREDIHRDALDCIQRAASLIPDQDEVWYELGAELNRRGKNAEALSALGTYLSRRPDNMDGLFEKAFALNALNQCDQALPLLKSLLARSPKDPVILTELAFSLDHLGRYRDGISAIQQAIAIEPSGDRYIELAFGCQQLEMWDEAADALSKAEGLGVQAKILEPMKAQIQNHQRGPSKVISTKEISTPH